MSPVLIEKWAAAGAAFRGTGAYATSSRRRGETERMAVLLWQWVQRRDERLRHLRTRGGSP